MKHPQRILLISHLAINDSNNVGKTLLNIFQEFKKENLFQLYFNSTPPNVNKCTFWYSITDYQVLHSMCGKKAGCEFSFEENYDDSKSTLYKKVSGKTTVRLLLRDIVWKLARIDYNSLYSWVQKCSPSVIFLAPGQSAFAYRIASKISQKYNIPIVTFLMDDFYNEKKSESFFEQCRIKWIRHSIKNCLKLSRKIYSVSETMANDYEVFCGKKIDVLYTPINIKKRQKPHTPDIHNLKFIYAGSIGLGRWEILRTIGQYLLEHYPKSQLTVYCSNDYNKELSNITQLPTVVYGGFVSSSQLDEIINDSDVLLHVESFDAKQTLRTRYSVSTKIPECMESGKYFLAVGPKGQAGLEYLKKHKAAIVCNSLDELFNAIETIHKENFDYSDYLRKSEELLKANHTAHSIHNKLSKDFLEIL